MGNLVSIQKMMFAATLLALGAVQVALCANLQLGYPTKVSVPGGSGKTQTCVLYVDVPIGATALRIYADKGWDSLNWLGGSGTKLYAGWALTTSPKAVASGSVTGAATQGDVMLTVDVNGAYGKYWILVESEKAADVYVSAVAYDIGQRPRVSVEIGKRTGVVAVEDGVAQIYRMALPANKATNVYINIDAGWIGTVGQGYDIYVNILDDKKIQMFTDSINIDSIGGFLSKLGSIISTGKLSMLQPQFLTPDAASHDLALKSSLLTGKAEFPVQASQQAPIVYVAIKRSDSVLAWSGKLSSFTVSFATTEVSADNSKFDTAPCANPTRRRDVEAVEAVEQTADECTGKVCGDCIAAPACQFCYGKSVLNNACRTKASGACPADSAPAVVAQCTECVSKTTESTCNANTNCKFCTGLSAGDVVSGCVNAWRCSALSGATNAPAADPAVGTTTATANAGGGATTKAGVDTKGSDATSLVLNVAVMLLAVALAF